MKYILHLTMLLGLSLACQAAEVQNTEKTMVTWQQVDLLIDQLVQEEAMRIGEYGKEKAIQEHTTFQSEAAEYMQSHAQDEVDDLVMVESVSAVSAVATVMSSLDEAVSIMHQVEDHVCPQSPKAVFITLFCAFLKRLKNEEISTVGDLNSLHHAWWEYVFSTCDQK